jgi:hypothetical protein
VEQSGSGPGKLTAWRMRTAEQQGRAGPTAQALGPLGLSSELELSLSGPVH